MPQPFMAGFNRIFFIRIRVSYRQRKMWTWIGDESKAGNIEGEGRWRARARRGPHQVHNNISICICLRSTLFAIMRCDYSQTCQGRGPSPKGAKAKVVARLTHTQIHGRTRTWSTYATTHHAPPYTQPPTIHVYRADIKEAMSLSCQGLCPILTP